MDVKPYARLEEPEACSACREVTDCGECCAKCDTVCSYGIKCGVYHVSPGGYDDVYMPPVLSGDEKSELESLEGVIRLHIKGFYLTGAALRQISVKMLYRQDYESFEDYLEDKWDFKTNYAYKQIAAANIRDEIKESLCTSGTQADDPEIENKLPNLERHVRPLTKLKDASERIAAWQMAMEQAAELKRPRVTAQMVEMTVRKMMPEPVVIRELPKISKALRKQSDMFIQTIVEEVKGQESNVEGVEECMKVVKSMLRNLKKGGGK